MGSETETDSGGAEVFLAPPFRGKRPTAVLASGKGSTLGPESELIDGTVLLADEVDPTSSEGSGGGGGGVPKGPPPVPVSTSAASWGAVDAELATLLGESLWRQYSCTISVP